MIDPGEEVLGEWRASLWVYLRKIFFYGGVTAVLLVVLGFAAGARVENALLGVLALPVCLLAYLIAFEDLGEWFQHRGDTWTLTSRKLHYGNPNTESGGVDLAEIEAVRNWMFWALRLRLSSGVTTTVAFVARRQEMRRAIEGAMRNA